MSNLRINLLPHREIKRKARKQQFFVYTGLAFLTGLVLGGLWFTVEARAVEEQEARNSFLTNESAKLDGRIKDIATLRTEIEALKSRQGAVETLQGNRNVAVALFNELVVALPKGVSIESIKQEGRVVTIAGSAESNERVAELIRNAAGPQMMISNPELVEVQQAATASGGAAAASPGAQRRPAARYSYALKVHLNPTALGQALVAVPAVLPVAALPVPGAAEAPGTAAAATVPAPASAPATLVAPAPAAPAPASKP